MFRRGSLSSLSSPDRSAPRERSFSATTGVQTIDGTGRGTYRASMIINGGSMFVSSHQHDHVQTIHGTILHLFFFRIRQWVMGAKYGKCMCSSSSPCRPGGEDFLDLRRVCFGGLRWHDAGQHRCSADLSCQSGRPPRQCPPGRKGHQRIGLPIGRVSLPKCPPGPWIL